MGIAIFPAEETVPDDLASDDAEDELSCRIQNPIQRFFGLRQIHIRFSRNGLYQFFFVQSCPPFPRFDCFEQFGLHQYFSRFFCPLLQLMQRVLFPARCKGLADHLKEPSQIIRLAKKILCAIGMLATHGLDLVIAA
jgi:hypothetical protein